MPRKSLILCGESAGIRTQDPRLKRAMLYQLSYRLSQDGDDTSSREDRDGRDLTTDASCIATAHIGEDAKNTAIIVNVALACGGLP